MVVDEGDLDFTPDSRRLMLRLQNAQQWIPQVTERVLFVTAEQIAEEARANKETPRDQGHGIRSIRPVSRSAQTAEVRMNDYMVVQDRGGKWAQKMPPIEPLTEWVTRRAGRGQIRLTTNSAEARVRAARRIAYAIALAIKRRGIKGRGFIGKAARETLDSTRWREAVRAEVRRGLRGGA